MRLDDLHQFFRNAGWYMKPNSSAYYSDKSPTLRYKITKLVVRKERLLGSAGWHRLSSANIKQLKVNDQGKLQGFKA